MAVAIVDFEFGVVDNELGIAPVGIGLYFGSLCGRTDVVCRARLRLDG